MRQFLMILIVVVIKGFLTPKSSYVLSLNLFGLLCLSINVISSEHLMLLLCFDTDSVCFCTQVG